MLNMVLPKIEVEASSQNYGHFVVSPLESGYGITLGNALRRVLLSSLPGAAVAREEEHPLGPAAAHAVSCRDYCGCNYC